MVEKSIPVFSNSLGSDEVEAVSDVFASGWLGQGPECQALEAELAERLGIERFLLTNSGTSSIYIALASLGLSRGDEVIVSSVNFVACASAVIAAGATLVFADVDRHTLNIRAEDIEKVKTANTRAVIILHYGGHPCDMDSIKDVCGDQIAIIEDAAIAFPGHYKGKSCGTIGDIGIFSFNAVKALAMGDGGGLAFRDEGVYEKAKIHRYLGLADGTRSGLDSLREKQAQRWWEFGVEELAGRHISNDILAAIGRVQLRKLDGFIQRRHEVWNLYQSMLSSVPGIQIPPEPLPDCKGAYFLYWLQIPERRDALAAHLAENGVYCTFRYFPLHLIDFFRSTVRLPGAEYANETTLNIPLHQNLSDNDVSRIVDLIQDFMASERR